jgi:hypothetical protein
MYAVSLIWIDGGKWNDRYGSSEWPHAAAELWSPVTGATSSAKSIFCSGSIRPLPNQAEL